MGIGIVYDDSFKAYDYGAGHPFRGDRYINFIRLFKKILKDKGEFSVVKPSKASIEDLMLVHSKEYVRRIMEGCRDSRVYDPDTPLHPNLEDAARLITGSSLTAGKLVMEDKFEKAVGIGGGMHHAKREREGGFCIYNDVAILTKKLLSYDDVNRVLILDTDVHAGDGTSDIFFADPQVMLIDIHQDPSSLYPGTGFIKQIGKGEGEGFTVNVPLPPGSTDDAYEIVLNEIIDPLAHEFQPDIIIRNGGSDPHFADTLASIKLTLKGFRKIGEKVREIAAHITNGKAIDLQGSGYNPAVLPYAWISITIGLAGIEMELEEPVPQTEEVAQNSTKKTAEIVKKVRNVLKPYWRSMRG